MVFEIILAFVAIIAGRIASLAGVGIGRLLTPLVAVKTGISTSVAGVTSVDYAIHLIRYKNRPVL